MVDYLLNNITHYACSNSSIWDYKLTWLAEVPDFTACFHKTVLASAPGLFLFIFTPLQLHYTKQYKTTEIAWTTNTFMKAITSALLVFITILECLYIILHMSELTTKIETFATFVRCSAMIASYTYVYTEITKGMNSTGVMFTFWLLQSICSIITYRSILLKHFILPPILHVTFLLSLPMIIVQFVFTALTDTFHIEVEEKQQLVEGPPCPERSASFYSRMTFGWVNSLIMTGYRRNLAAADLWALDEENTAGAISEKYNREWDKEKERRNPTCLLRAIYRSYGSDFIISALIKLVCDILVFANPLLLRRMIHFTSSSEPQWHGYYYAALMSCTAMLLSLLINQHNHKMQYFATRVKTAMMMSIYRKALRISTPAKKHIPMGEVVNVMAIDTQVIVDMITEVIFYWSAPLQLLIAIYMLWSMLGVAVFAGLIVMVFFIPTNTLIASTIKRIQARMMKCRDKRMMMMNEVLTGIKMLKLYAWERSFFQLVRTLREVELQEQMKISYVRALVIFLFHITPILVSLATLGTYVMLNDDNVLDPSKVFVSISLLQVMRGPLNSLPTIVTLGLQASVSFRRILVFMNTDERDEKDVLHEDLGDEVVVIQGGTFTWSIEETPAVCDINMRVKEGSLVMIVGPIGAGKSSLLISMLGELEKISGTVNTTGTIAYVPQQAWIKNATLRKNILFGLPLNHNRFQSVLSACALLGDLDLLPGRDFTEIGEKGVNVSGGQRQRISLARAVYSDSDIYLLDDPLSAVDSHVGKHIVDHVIGPYGLLRKKTRILASHGIVCLPYADYIYVMHNGRIQEEGTFKQLVRARGAFLDFVLMFIKDQSVLDEVESYSASSKTLLEDLEKVSPDRSEEDLKTAIQSQAEINVRMNVLKQMLVSSLKGKRGLVSTTSENSRRLSYPPTEHSVEPIAQTSSEQARRFSYAGQTEHSTPTPLPTPTPPTPDSDEESASVSAAKRTSERWNVFQPRVITPNHLDSSSDELIEEVNEEKENEVARREDEDEDDKNIKKQQDKDDKTKKQSSGGQSFEPEIDGVRLRAAGLRDRPPPHFVDRPHPVSRSVSLLSQNPALGRRLSIEQEVIPISHSASMPMFVHHSVHDLAPRFTNMELERRSRLITDEFTETGEVSWGVYNYYLSSLSYVVAVTSVLLFLMSEICTVMGNMWLSKWSRDSSSQEEMVPSDEDDPNLKTYRMQIYAMLGVGQAFFMLLGTLCLTHGTLRASHILHDRMLENVMNSPMHFFDTTPIGRLINRFSKDIEAVDENVPRPLRPLITHIMHIMATIYIITLNTPTFIFVTPPLTVLYYCIQKVYMRTSRQLKRLEAVSRSPIFTQFTETLSGLATVRAYKQEPRFIKEAEHAIDLNQVLTYPRISVKRWLALRLDFVGNLVVFATAAFATYSRASIDPGVVGLIISYSVQVTHLLSVLVRMAGDLENHVVAVERVKQYSELPNEIDTTAIEVSSQWPDTGEVIFTNYCLRYRDDLDLSLKYINIKIHSGEKIGIVGRTGAGKSSMTLALFRVIEPSEGTILIDGIDITKISLYTLRSSITIIPQEPILFTGSLMLNLDPLKKHSMAEIEAAIHHAHLGDFVRSLPDGLNYEIVESGENISAGQRQLVCLARALLRKSKVLVLDEATAAVDLETDELIQETIREKFKDCTVLSIAHRLNTVLECSRVLVLEAGEVVEFDAPSILLMDEESTFYGMVKDAGLLGKF